MTTTEVKKKAVPKPETAVTTTDPQKQPTPAVPAALQATTPAIWKDKLNRMEGELENALVKRIPTELFIRSALTMINKTPKLMSCTSFSVLAALMEAAQLGLSPDTTLQYCYILPYGDQAEFQLGYKGLIKLVRDQGGYDVAAEVVHKKDEFDYSLGTDKFIKHKPAYLEEDRGPVIAAWASMRDINGNQEFRILPVKRLKEIRAMSKAPNSPAWTKSEDEMNMKIVLKVLLKTQDLSPKIKEIIDADDKREFGDLNVPTIASPKFDSEAQRAATAPAPIAPAPPSPIPPQQAETREAEYTDQPATPTPATTEGEQAA